MFSGRIIGATVIVFRVAGGVSCGLTGFIENKGANYTLNNKNRIN